jgi:hypothetical protein
MYSFTIALSLLMAHISFLNANFPSKYIPPRTVPAAAAAVTIGRSHVS